MAHCRRDGNADDPPHWKLLKAICVESNDQAIELILRRAPLAVIPFPDESKPRKRNACQGYGLYGEDHAINGGCVRQNGLNISQFNAESDWTGALSSAFFPKLDEPLAIEFDSQPPQPALKEGETRRLGSSDAFPAV